MSVWSSAFHFGNGKLDFSPSSYCADIIFLQRTNNKHLSTKLVAFPVNVSLMQGWSQGQPKVKPTRTSKNYKKKKNGTRDIVLDELKPYPKNESLRGKSFS